MKKVNVLNRSTLGFLPNGIQVPLYNLDELSAGILHFGIGNFHRSHQAVFLDKLFSKGIDHDWAILGAGVIPEDMRQYNALQSQECLFAVVEQSPEQSTAAIIGSIKDFIEPCNTNAILQVLADPKIRIVSLTITEGGYFIDSDTGSFNNQHHDIIADSRSPKSPRTVFGLIVAGLRMRRNSNTAPFTVMSCDNIPHNGVVARNATCGLAQMSDAAFADWISENVAFPNSMVDRITPATGDRERRQIVSAFGVHDKSPVFCEDYLQWVLEDNFCAGRPRLEEVGVQFVEDVTPFETMKIRILNGGHAAIAYSAGLLGIEYVHNAMEHSVIAKFLQAIVTREIIQVVPSVPGTNLNGYLRKVTERFSNPHTGDTVRRIAHDGSNRQPKFIIPSIADRVERNLPIDGLALVSAMWCRYCLGITEAGAEIRPNDRNWTALNKCANAAKQDCQVWIRQRQIYGGLGDQQMLMERFAFWTKKVWEAGVVGAMTYYIDGGRAQGR